MNKMNLSPAERSELESMVRRQTTPAAQARRYLSAAPRTERVHWV